MNRCALCPNKNNCVQGIGPVGADILFLGEAPGKDEDRKQIPFVGKTGQELDETYLPLVGVRRSSTRIDNSISCYPDTSDHKLKKDNTQHRALLQSCTENHLYPYLLQHPPKIIVAMGAFACLAVDPDISLDLHHGIPIQTKWGVVWPSFHPALGMHEPKKMRDIYTDFVRLGDYLHGRLDIPVDEHPDPDYQECNSYMIKEEIDPTQPIACDTEWSRSLGSYCLTYSQAPGTGRLIRANQFDLLSQFQTKMDRWEDLIYLHNYLYDWNTTGDMAVKFKFKHVRDTMLRAFHLGIFSKKDLKTLAYRELGMTMQDFDDLVMPYSRVHVIDYYRQAYTDHEWPKPPKRIKIQEDGTEKGTQPHSMKTKLKTFFTYLAKDPEGKDVFAAWENWVEDWEMIEEKCGRWPGKDIAHVPFEQMKYYACRDADATIRLVPILERMVANAEAGLPQERW